MGVNCNEEFFIMNVCEFFVIEPRLDPTCILLLKLAADLNLEKYRFDTQKYSYKCLYHRIIFFFVLKEIVRSHNHRGFNKAQIKNGRQINLTVFESSRPNTLDLNLTNCRLDLRLFLT